MTSEASTRRPPGAPCWVSLMVHGLAATQDFYGTLFGWDYRPGPQHFGPYVRALLNGREVAGIGELPPDRQLPVAWTTYLASDDADETAERITMRGGTIGVGPLDADQEGRMTLASDPEGAVFGVWQGKAMTGTAVVGEPGTPVWNELVTRDTSTIGKFYESVFDMVAEPVVSADYDYLTLQVKGHPVAGIHGIGHALPRDESPHWMTYFAVTDTEATVRRVRELGGHVVRGAHDTAHGRQATVADPEGAVFVVVEDPGEETREPTH